MHVKAIITSTVLMFNRIMEIWHFFVCWYKNKYNLTLDQRWKYLERLSFNQLLNKLPWLKHEIDYKTILYSTIKLYNLKMLFWTNYILNKILFSTNLNTRKKHKLNSRPIKMFSAKNPEQNFSLKKKKKNLPFCCCSLMEKIKKVQWINWFQNSKTSFWTTFCLKTPVLDFSQKIHLS